MRVLRTLAILGLGVGVMGCGQVSVLSSASPSSYTIVPPDEDCQRGDLATWCATRLIGATMEEADEFRAAAPTDLVAWCQIRCQLVRAKDLEP